MIVEARTITADISALHSDTLFTAK